MKKNVVIAVLGIVLVGQSVIFWVSKPSAKASVSTETITDGAASSLAVAAETQNQICFEFPTQMAWLREQLEKTISVLEKKYQLEPLAGRFPESHIKTEPFVTPYEQPDCHSLGLETDALKTSDGLQKLAAKMDLCSSRATMINNSMNARIENFSQRLQRLEPLLEQDK
jgi:hypothetical protein